MPYDHKSAVASRPHDQYTLSMMHALNNRSCNHQCVVGSGGASVGYLAHGTATDYMYEVLNIPVAMTWEIYGDLAAPFADCFRAFNPITADQYHSTIRNWSNMLFHTIFLMAQHPVVAHLSLSSSHRPTAASRGRHWMQHADIVSLGRGDVVGSGVRQKGNNKQVYEPNRALFSGGGLFVGTLLLWCIARRFMRGGRQLQRLACAVDVAGQGLGGARDD
jgi:hypothetical protein